MTQSVPAGRAEKDDDFAPTGRGVLPATIPRALPWADRGCPVGALQTAKHSGEKTLNSKLSLRSTRRGAFVAKRRKNSKL